MHRIKLAWILSFMVLVAVIHTITVLNKTYIFKDIYYTSERYDQLISKTAPEARYYIITNTRSAYFNDVPLNRINIFYACYLLAIILVIIKINTDYKIPRTREQGLKMITDYQTAMRALFASKGWPTIAEQVRKDIDERKRQASDK